MSKVVVISEERELIFPFWVLRGPPRGALYLVTHRAKHHIATCRSYFLCKFLLPLKLLAKRN